MLKPKSTTKNPSKNGLADIVTKTPTITQAGIFNENDKSVHMEHKTKSSPNVTPASSNDRWFKLLYLIFFFLPFQGKRVVFKWFKYQEFPFTLPLSNGAMENRESPQKSCLEGL